MRKGGRKTDLNIPDRLRSSETLLLRRTRGQYALPRSRRTLVVSSSRSIVLPSFRLTVNEWKMRLCLQTVEGTDAPEAVDLHKLSTLRITNVSRETHRHRFLLPCRPSRSIRSVSCAQPIQVPRLRRPRRCGTRRRWSLRLASGRTGEGESGGVEGVDGSVSAGGAGTGSRGVRTFVTNETCTYLLS
jgi:hypothetical protein